MTNILVTYEVVDNTTDVNVVSLTDMFNCMGVSYRFMKASKVRNRDMEWCDILISIRPNSKYSYRIAYTVKKAGRYYIPLIDDDIINLDRFYPDYWKKEYTVSCMELGDAMFTPNPYIKDDYCSRFNVKPILMNAHVNGQDIKPMHTIGKKIRIIYPAARDHAKLFNRYLTPVLKKLLINFKDTLDITFVGVVPDLGNLENVHYLKNMSYSDYMTFMRSESFDIGLAPLEDTPFCKKKYFIKYIEYAKYGIMGMYSNVYPYKYAVIDKRNGIMVNNTVEDWERALTEVLENTSMISGIIAASQSDLRNKYSIQAVTRDFISQCPEINSFKAPAVSVRYFPMTPGTLFYDVRNILNKVVCRLTHRRPK